jgi:hypothetical protein
VLVELEMGLVRLDRLVAMAETRAMTTVAAVVSSSELVMVIAVALIGLELLHVHNPLSCGHRRQPVSLVSPVPHTEAQVYHCD